MKNNLFIASALLLIRISVLIFETTLKRNPL